MTNLPVIDKFLHAIETADIPGCDAWSADATLDATVPNWRLHASGADAIRAEYSRWFADPGHFDELRRYSVEGGEAEVVEYTLSWTENGVPHAGQVAALGLGCNLAANRGGHDGAQPVRRQPWLTRP